MNVDEKGKRREKNSYENVLFNQHPLLASIINFMFIMFLSLCRLHVNNSLHIFLFVFALYQHSAK
jgi:hypothetical protein